MRPSPLGPSGGRVARLISGAAAGALLVLAGCTSGGSADPPSTPGTTAATAPASTPGPADGSSPASTPGSAAGSTTGSTAASPASVGTPTGTVGSGSSAPPDPASATWFATLCREIQPVLDLDITGTAGPAGDVAARQEAAVTTLDTISRAYADAGAALATVPPPGIDGGAEFAGRVTAALTDASARLAESMAAVTAMDPTAPDAAAALDSTLATGRETAGAPIDLLLDLPPETRAATGGIPSCVFLAGS